MESTQIIVARIEERLASLKQSIETSSRNEEKELEALKVSVETLNVRIKVIEEMAVRYKGGFIVVLAVGGIIGWITSNIEFVKNIGNWLKGS